MAEPADAEGLLMIYRPYVEHTAITFEHTVPTVEEFSERIRKTLETYPYLVAMKAGKAVGYAYAGRFRQRKAYDWSVETSIYVKGNEKEKGIGRMLYSSLENLLAKQGVLNMNACIAYTEQENPYLTNGSVAFHKKMGFSLVGQFHQCGYKFRQWYDMVWMEKHIGKHLETPQAVRKVNEITDR